MSPSLSPRNGKKVLDGALYCTQAAIVSMVKNGYGRVLFFTGEGAFTGDSGRAHVSVAKMGLVGLARGLASEFAGQNIRANAVSRGSIDTRRDNPDWYRRHVPSAPGSRSVVNATSTKSPPPACFWSATAAASSPARRSTSTAAPATTKFSRVTRISGRRNSRRLSSRKWLLQAVRLRPDRFRNRPQP